MRQKDHYLGLLICYCSLCRYGTKRSPVDYESIDKTEFWIMEKEGEGELDFSELEDKLLEEYPKDSEETQSWYDFEFYFKIVFF